MLTVSFCPIRCARDIAWKSFCGFQSESKMMTVSAVARLMPSPPARVERRKTKSRESGALKWSIACVVEDRKKRKDRDRQTERERERERRKSE